MTATPRETLGVLLMTYGSPATLEDVPAFLASTRGGRPAPEELIAEFRRRYRTIGGSPLVRITREQAAAVEAQLNASTQGGERYVVGAGMRHAPPLIGDELARLAERGARQVAAVILSPQYSPYIMGGYHRAVDTARERLPEGVEVTVAGAWHLHPKFVRALANRVEEALDRFPPELRDNVPVILTSHSLPKAVVDKEPQYLEQLQETVRAIVQLTGLDRGAGGAPRWQFAYQSAGHTPEEWLKPDMKDLMPGLRAAGHRHVLMVPVQFLADHLEILYDIDVAARQEAESVGLEFHRIESLNCMPLFIEALADVARETLRRSRGTAGEGDAGTRRRGDAENDPHPSPLPRGEGVTATVS
jgi:ferrochelatase